jgi:hypothetical protein
MHENARLKPDPEMFEQQVGFDIPQNAITIQSRR